MINVGSPSSILAIWSAMYRADDNYFSPKVLYFWHGMCGEKASQIQVHCSKEKFCNSTDEIDIESSDFITSGGWLDRRNLIDNFG